MANSPFTRSNRGRRLFMADSPYACRCEHFDMLVAIAYQITTSRGYRRRGFKATRGYRQRGLTEATRGYRLRG